MFLEVLDKGTASSAGGAAGVGPGGLRGGKAVLPDLLLCCICWVLGEYGGLASQLPPPHRVNSGQVCRDRDTAARLVCGVKGRSRAGLRQQACHSRLRTDIWAPAFLTLASVLGSSVNGKLSHVLAGMSSTTVLHILND